MLQEKKPDAACMYVHTSSFETYSDRHVLGLLPCAGVIALCYAVLCCALLCPRFNDNILHTTAVLLLLYTDTALTKGLPEEWKMKAQHCCIKCLKTCWLSLTLHASVVVWYVRKKKHSKARHITAQHGTPRQGTTPHGPAWRCAATLS